jgi:preprotein translocase subunit SecD
VRASTLRLLIAIILLAVATTWIAWPFNREIAIDVAGVQIQRDISIREGLDLQGGIQVLLEPDLPAGSVLDADALVAASQVIESRINALGVSEPVIQIADQNRIIVEIPGVRDPDQAIRTFGQTGLLEFINAGSTFVPEGVLVTTSEGGPIIANESGTAAAPPIIPDRVFPTILQGRHLSNADVGFDEFNRPQIHFTLTDEGAQIFGTHTQTHVGQYLAITMDKRVLSSPVIQSPILGGSGVINGRFTLDEARNLVIQLKYGALPVPLKVVQSRTVGPTLGQDSVQKSIVAGIIGLGLVAAFMLAYYRLPGLIAVVALVIYASIVFSLFKLIPVTMTLAGIAGFLLSVGMAVDANILIFERMKEELRAGRTVGGAIEAGFGRAWTSIRDSNVSTLITCAILFWFGSTFGASIIQGFALTLAIGVMVSMFTAVIVTRTFLRAMTSIVPPERLTGSTGLDIQPAGAQRAI